MKAYELLSGPGKWTRSRYAKTKDGIPCDPLSDEAIQFCVLGAIRRCYHSNYKVADILADKLRQELQKREIRDNIVSWNDDIRTTQEEVVAILEQLDI